MKNDALIKAENDATLSIIFDNDTLEWNATDCEFDNIQIKGSCAEMDIDNCSFTDSEIFFTYGDLTLSNSNLYRTFVSVYDPNETSNICEIFKNVFDSISDTTVQAVITIDDYYNFKIEKNTIKYNTNRGVELFYAGWDESEHHIIDSNLIEFTGFQHYPHRAELGIHSYYSNADITDNEITDNDYGITGFHRSDLVVQGDSTARNNDETQQIMNNIHGQCLFNQGSFPTEFHYNVIGSTVTNEFPYIKAVEYDEIKIDTTSNPDWEGDPEFEVQNNCWILNNVNDTNPEDNLVPDGAYEWRNVWCPGSSGTAEEKQGEALYYSALSNIESQNYSTAESKFKQVIETYPSSKYAQASLKGLYGLNPNLNDSSYSNLKSYCDSLALNPGDSVLGKSAEWIAIHCDIKDEEYQDAIDALDSIIINPGSYADSIFAIIDLDYVYSKAGDSSLLKTSLTTSHQHLISHSNTQFRKNRFLRIEELIKPTKVQPKNDKPYGEIIDENQPLSILSIFPNPARNEISIKYKVNGKGKVILKLYSSQGRMIDSKFLGRMNPGTYETNLSLASFTKGMYFVILAKDDVLVDSRKVLKVD